MKNNTVKFIKKFEDDKGIKVIEEILSKQSSGALEEELNQIKLQNLGERVINFELMNCYLNINVLHNLNINNLLFDFLITCENFICSITVLNLQDNYEINEYGELFLLDKSIGNPFLTSRERIKQLNQFLKENKLVKDTPFYSFIINTNKNSVILRNKAPEYITRNLFCSDDLVNELSKLNEINKNKSVSEKVINKVNEFILSNNDEFLKDYESNIEKTSFEFTLDTAKEGFASTIRQLKKFSKDATTKYENYSSKKSLEIMKSMEEEQ